MNEIFRNRLRANTSPCTDNRSLTQKDTDAIAEFIKAAMERAEREKTTPKPQHRRYTIAERLCIWNMKHHHRRKRNT